MTATAYADGRADKLTLRTQIVPLYTLWKTVGTSVDYWSLVLRPRAEMPGTDAAGIGDAAKDQGATKLVDREAMTELHGQPQRDEHQFVGNVGRQPN